MKECKDCIHYEVCGYHVTEETDMTVEECANTFVDRENVVEVCRCKDCEFSRKNLETLDLFSCNIYRDIRKGSDFCNYGKRKESK